MFDHFDETSAPFDLGVLIVLMMAIIHAEGEVI
jgi:hypothetical protein